MFEAEARSERGDGEDRGFREVPEGGPRPDQRARRRRRSRPGRRALPLLLAGLFPVVAGCGDDGPTDPTPPPNDGVPGSQLLFLRNRADAPPLLTTDTSFVATRGQSLSVRLFYESESNPGEPGQEFLSFELEDESLLRYPEDHPRAGALFQPGDTVTISIRVASDTVLAEFEPTGLRFDPDAPAELEISYANADDDFDDDGASDPEREEEIDLWKQERPGDPWIRTGTVQDFELDEIEAILTSFTRFAAAI